MNVYLVAFAKHHAFNIFELLYLATISAVYLRSKRQFERHVIAGQVEFMSFVLCLT